MNWIQRHRGQHCFRDSFWILPECSIPVALGDVAARVTGKRQFPARDEAKMVERVTPSGGCFDPVVKPESRP
jgi:hypothetical protein